MQPINIFLSLSPLSFSSSSPPSFSLPPCFTSTMRVHQQTTRYLPFKRDCQSIRRSRLNPQQRA
jgi:hypothetical protein